MGGERGSLPPWRRRSAAQTSRRSATRASKKLLCSPGRARNFRATIGHPGPASWAGWRTRRSRSDAGVGGVAGAESPAGTGTCRRRTLAGGSRRGHRGRSGDQGGDRRRRRGHAGHAPAQPHDADVRRRQPGTGTPRRHHRGGQGGLCRGRPPAEFRRSGARVRHGPRRTDAPPERADGQDRAGQPAGLHGRGREHHPALRLAAAAAHQGSAVT
jgi:hypothetical protein